MNQPPGGGGYGGPPGGGGYGGPPAYPPKATYGANPAAPGQLPQNPYAAPPGYGQAPSQPGDYRQAPYQAAQPGQPWPAPVPLGSVPGANAWANGGDASVLASKDPQQVFMFELLMTGIFGIPGIGHLIIGETGWGLALLIGYPILVWGGWTLIILFSCGIGAFLVPLQWPLNFMIGYFLGNRVKQRVLEARAFVSSTGQSQSQHQSSGGWPR